VRDYQRFAKRSQSSGRLTEEESFSRATIDEILVWQTHHFHDTSELLLFVLTREDRVAGIHLCDDTTETPHLSLRSLSGLRKRLNKARVTYIDSHVIVHPEYHFGTTVESRLNIGIDCSRSSALSATFVRLEFDEVVFTFLMLKATTSEIDYFDRALGRMFEQDVL